MKQFKPQHFTAWAEIPVRDLDRGVAFYAAVTGGILEKVEMGGDPVAYFVTEETTQNVSANLFVGEPGDGNSGPTIFLAIPDRIEDALDRVWQTGGRIASDVIEIPPGRVAYANDPDGNRFGLFEAI